MKKFKHILYIVDNTGYLFIYKTFESFGMHLKLSIFSADYPIEIVRCR